MSRGGNEFVNACIARWYATQGDLTVHRRLLVLMVIGVILANGIGSAAEPVFRAGAHAIDIPTHGGIVTINYY